MQSSKYIQARQIAFFCAFLLPVYKLVETPSLLAGFMKGDLLLPAFLHFCIEFALLSILLVFLSKSEKTLYELLQERLGKGARVLFLGFFFLYLAVAILPLFDLEKFVYAVFYDTSPTLFSFAFFFLFSAFYGVRGLKATSRLADCSIFLFLLPFVALLLMSLIETDFSNLLPFLDSKFVGTRYALTYTKGHFNDLLFLFPLLLHLRVKKGDRIKISLGYLLGCIFTLVFLAVFYALFSSVAPREHYAFSKIAQYFPILSVVGRIDLILVYMLCILLFVYVATPLQYTNTFLCEGLNVKGKSFPSALLNLGLFIIVLFCNKYYNKIYALVGNYFYPFFYLAEVALVTLSCLLTRQKKSKKEKAYA